MEQRQKLAALVVYGPGGGSHIGLVESVSGSGINDYVSIEGNTSGATGGLAARKQYGNRRSDVYGFCYIDYPVTTISVGSGATISGTPNRYQRDCNNPAYAHGIIQYIHIGIVDGMVILCKEGLQIYGMRKDEQAIMA